MDDLISRQAAIDAVNGMPDCPNGYSDTYDKAHIIAVLEDVPSVQPEKMQLSKEDATFPVEGATLDCISRQQAILAIERNAYRHTYVDQIVDIIKWLPSVEELKSEAWDTAYLEGYTAGQNAQPKYVALHESCTDCPLYDHERHSCPRFNRVIPMAIRDAQHQRWIPVAEALPKDVPIGEEYPVVIFCTKDMTFSGCYEHYGKGRWWSDVDDSIVDSVVAWMPMPEPWRGEETCTKNAK